MTLFREEHAPFRTRVRTFVEERLRPHADDWETRRVFPAGLIRELGQEGLLGLAYPTSLGGQGLDFGHNIVLAEELPRSRMMGLTLSVLAQTNFFPRLLDNLGTEEQKQAYLGPALRGEKIGAFAATEPTGGSDTVRAVQCTAEDHGDFWLVNGEKKYITNGPIADFVITLVRTRTTPGPTSLTLLIVPTDLPGFRVKETLRKLGLHTSPTGWLRFDAVRVPKNLTLGKVHFGYFHFARNILEERLVGGAAAVSVASLVLDDTIRHLRQRIAFQRPLSKLQTVRHRVSEMAAEIEVSRRFVYSVCESFRDGNLEEKEICMIKYHVFEMVQRVVERCIQLHGGSGFMEDNWVSRVYRDVRVLTIGGGSSELMKDLVAAYLRL